MAAITREELAQGLEDLYNEWSNREDLNPEEARKQLSIAQANLFANYVDGRETQVQGTTSDGKTVTGTGIIQAD